MITQTAAIIISRDKENQQRVRSEEHYRLIVESAKEYAIITLDMAGVIVDWNAGAERMLGYREAEIVGQPGSIFFLPEDQAAGQPEHEMQRAREEGRTETERWHVCKDGSRFWGNGIMMPLTNGHQRGYVKIFQNRSAQRAATQLLEQAATALHATEESA